MAIATLNPATGTTEAEFDAFSDAQIDSALTASAAASSHVRQVSIRQRADWLLAAAKVLRDEKDRFGRLMTTEMGKPLEQAVAEAEKCALVCEFYAEHGERFLSDTHIKTEHQQSFVRPLPIGPVLAVMPWNYPFWQVMRFAAPALIGGNTALLKHASNVPQCALALQDLFARAGVPEGVFQTLLIGGDQVEHVLSDSRVRAATLTGSEPAGSAVAKTAGRTLKKIVLELGGSDPFIVMPSADMDLAVDQAVKGRTQNNGQSCIAAKRFIIHADIYATFRERFAERIGALTVGDPLQSDTDIGPLATKDIRSDLDEQVSNSIALGANLVTGCKVNEGDGWYYTPGLIENIPASAPAYTEELFGPVGSLFKVGSLDEAIQLGNATRFGLGSALFTSAQAEMDQAFDQLDAGATFINTITASDPRLPFGGVKASGHGRELAENGLKEFLNLKTCVVAEPS